MTSTRWWSLGLAAGLVLSGLAVLPSVASEPAASPARPGPLLFGTVTVGGDVVEGATVRLFRAGRSTGHARELAMTETGPDGEFAFRTRDLAAGPFYLTAGGGPLPHEVVLATALGPRHDGSVAVTERTTVAAGFALAQFAVDGRVGGAEPGLSNAMLMARNLASISTGRAAEYLRTKPNGTATQTFPTFNSLASIITGCATGANDCGAFLDAASGPFGKRPETTWQAMAMVPRNPSGDAEGIFAQLPADPRFRPVLAEAPAAWVLALKFIGNGRQYNGPGNIAFDENGMVWANNNAEWAVKLTNVCAGTEVFELNPFVPRHPVTGYAGGGVNGAGFAVSFDPDGHLWVANFGFSGTKCPTPPTSNSMSEFRPNGTPISPPKGYRHGPLSWPQGAKSTTDGDIWIANCGNSTVVRYPDGDPRRSEVVGTDVQRAFDVAFNTEGNAFVTANRGDQVFGFYPDGSPLPRSPYGDSSVFQDPLGIASDRSGNTWVSNSGVIPSPCKSGQTFPDLAQIADRAEDRGKLAGSVVRVGPHGRLTRYTGAGLTIPWGIAVDGDDNVWVANFTGQRVSHLCGDRPQTCPTGHPGDPISPSGTGYPFDGLQRNTGVQIDPSGNVWVTNNWKKVPLQVNPFGNGLVAYVGMAAPVRAPLIGTPRRP